MQDSHNNTAAAIAAGARFGEARNLPGFVPYTLLPEGTKLEHLERLDERPNPEHVKASPEFDDAASLIHYFNRFKDVDSTIFADLDTSKIVGVIDHHQAENHDDDGNLVARYHDHLATFTAKHSPEWKIWLGKNGAAMDQVAFAQFVEDNAPDIQFPSAGEVIEMALKFEAVKQGSFKSGHRLQDGSSSVSYQDDTTGSAGGGAITIPKEIELFIPVYQGGAPEKVIARFRYRLSGGSLAMWYDLLRIENLKRAAFQAIIDKVNSETGTFVLAGRSK